MRMAVVCNHDSVVGAGDVSAEGSAGGEGGGGSLVTSASVIPPAVSRVPVSIVVVGQVRDARA